MATITVVYPHSEGATFDFDYYANTHLPLVSSTFSGEGLTEVRALRGMPGPDGGPAPFVALALISFDTLESLVAAQSGPKIAPILADIANFTSIQPIAQVSQPLA